MGERSEHPPGTPSWVDLASPDLDASKRFYAEVLGWEATTPGPVEQTGGYTLFTKDGKVVAGLGPQQAQGPPMWTTYVTVADADAAFERARELGAQTIVAPLDVIEEGRMAVLVDPGGAAFALWQPRNHIGAQLVNAPGSLCWNELNTAHPDVGEEFYTALFGWDPAHVTDDGVEYTVFSLGDRRVAAMVRTPDDGRPAEGPPYWLATFAVADTDAATEKVRELGGTVHVEPRDHMVGRWSIVSDPHGAVFMLAALTQADE